MNRFQNIDWDQLYKVLLVQATVFLRRYRGPDTFDGGQDCEDVVAEVLKEFLQVAERPWLETEQGKARNLSWRGCSQQARGPSAPSEAREWLA